MGKGGALLLFQKPAFFWFPRIGHLGGGHSGIKGKFTANVDNDQRKMEDAFCAGLIPPKTDKRYDDTIRYAIVAAKRAMIQAGIEKEAAQRRISSR